MADDYATLQTLIYRKYSTLRIETRGDGLDVLTLHQPPMNPLSDRMFLELAHYFFRLRTDASTRVVILRAEGKAFSAGLDLTEQGGATGGDKEESVQVQRVVELQRRVSDVVKQMRGQKPPRTTSNPNPNPHGTSTPTPTPSLIQTRVF